MGVIVDDLKLKFMLNYVSTILCNFTSVFVIFCLRTNFYRIFEISCKFNLNFETRFHCFYSENNNNNNNNHLHQLKNIIINNNKLQTTKYKLQTTHYNTTIINIKRKSNLQIYTSIFH